MKNTFTPLCFIALAVLMSLATGVNAQCTNATLNWDNLDFLSSNNVRYTSFYPNAAFPYDQNFAMGTRTVNFTMAPQNNITLNGENGTNTAHTGSLPATSGAGDDVQFTTAAATATTITMTFDANVTNLEFSLFDLDNGQSVNITATNAIGSAVAITTVANANGTSGINIAGSGSNSATATGPAGGYIDSDNRGTLNVHIDGGVSKIVLTLAGAAGNIWLSDLGACVTGTFPNNYQIISRPFTGQPQYVLAVVNNNIYYIDPSNGQGYFLFNEPGHTRLNSMAYDPYKRIVYYTYSLTGNAVTDKTLKKYDVDSKTISVVIPDVNTFGIPTYESGVESGAATFYNGSLYLGIEGYTGTDNTGNPYAAGRKSTIWKINFDAAGNAVPPAAQVWGVTADDGTNAQNIHDWSDFAISNGVLTDFDGSQSGQIDYYKTNLFTGVRQNWAPVGPVPRQVSIGYDEKLYNVDVSLAQYNNTNGVVAGTTFNIFAPLGPTIPVGSTAVASWGDAAGPYRPFLDFGDAPATYDPDPWSPACHDTLTPTVTGRRTKLRLGPNEDLEWLKRGVTTVEDNFEDGLAFVPIFAPGSGTYLAQVTAFNNTGANATICAWLDFNGNGLFDAAEGINPITVVSSAATQTIPLVWPSAPSTLPFGSYTYLRIRITSSSITKNNATGYYNTGEVEDYIVVVDNGTLSLQMMSFDAELLDNQSIRLTWEANEEVGLAGYDVERSVNGSEWDRFAFVPSTQVGGRQQYELLDKDPAIGKTLYRVKMGEYNGHERYSNIRAVEITQLPGNMSIFPNPAVDKAKLTVIGTLNNQSSTILILDAKGNPLTQQKIFLNPGTNAIELPIHPSWRSGVYFVRVITGDKVELQKLVLQRR